MRRLPIAPALILLGAVPASLSAQGRITVDLKPEEGVTCTELMTPKPWTVPRDSLQPGIEQNRFLYSGAHFEFRGGSRLLISVGAGSGHSPDRYAIIQQNSKYTMVPVTDSEWEVGRVLPQSKAGADGKAENGKPLPYASRTFAPSGRYWWLSPSNSTRLSVDKAHLALVSWDGTVNIPEPFGIFQSTRMKGHYFVDLYHVPTGRRLALIRGTFRGIPPDFATMSFWIEGPRFIMPASEDMRRFVLCEVR